MADDSGTQVYTVPDVSCGHCVSAIGEAVGEVAGVAQVQVDLIDKRVTVEGSANDREVRAAISEAGYEAL